MCLEGSGVRFPKVLSQPEALGFESRHSGKSPHFSGPPHNKSQIKDSRPPAQTRGVHPPTHLATASRAKTPLSWSPHDVTHSWRRTRRSFLQDSSKGRRLRLPILPLIGWKQLLVLVVVSDDVGGHNLGR